MGVERWLLRVDPLKWERALSSLQAHPPRDLPSAEAFLQSFGRSLDEDLQEYFHSPFEEEEEAAHAINQLLEVAVQEESWEMGRGLDALAPMKHLPQGELLSLILEFQGLDRPTPSYCSTENGLYGCCSFEAYEPCWKLLERYNSVESIRRAVAEEGDGFWTKLSGRRKRMQAAVEALEDKGLWSHWEQLHDALRACASAGHHLGLGMDV